MQKVEYLVRSTMKNHQMKAKNLRGENEEKSLVQLEFNPFLGLISDTRKTVFRVIPHKFLLNSNFLYTAFVFKKLLFFREINWI